MRGALDQSKLHFKNFSRQMALASIEKNEFDFPTISFYGRQMTARQQKKNHHSGPKYQVCPIRRELMIHSAVA
jgi:hypothetical protein